MFFAYRLLLYLKMVYSYKFVVKYIKNVMPKKAISYNTKNILKLNKLFNNNHLLWNLNC